MTEHLPELDPLDGLGKAVVYEAFDGYACKEEGEEDAERFGLSEKTGQGNRFACAGQTVKSPFYGIPVLLSCNQHKTERLRALTVCQKSRY